MRWTAAVVFTLAVIASGSSADAKTHAKKKAHHARTAHVATRTTMTSSSSADGQSIGQPWNGTLHDATQFPEGDGYVIRRPQRSFGTRSAVAYVAAVVHDVRDEFPDRHVLAIGDFSQEHGGAITEHRSHQTGRDVDIGLFYVTKPASYPREFVKATEDNLDCEATLALIERFAATAHKDGGVQVMFLDYEVQGILYHWGLDHGVAEAKLDRLFQFAHGRGSSDGLVRHYPGHENHVHVRFKCSSSDRDCR